MNIYKEVVDKLNASALDYKATKSRKSLNELNDNITEYLSIKNLGGITKNISPHLLRDITTDIITTVVLDIDKLDLNKYAMGAIVIRNFRHMLIWELRRTSKIKYVSTDYGFDKYRPANTK